MNKITTIGVDLAKNVFHLVCSDQDGKVVTKKMLKRRQMLAHFVNLPPLLRWAWRPVPVPTIGEEN